MIYKGNTPWNGRYSVHLSLMVPYLLPGNNDIITVRSSRYRGQWNNLKKKCEDAIVEAYRKQYGDKKLGKQRYTIIFTWYEWNSARDPGNIAGGGEKVIMDALQAAGCIEDDGWEWVESYTHRFRAAKDQDSVGVRVEFWTDHLLQASLKVDAFPPKGREREVKNRLYTPPKRKARKKNSAVNTVLFKGTL